MSTHLLTYISTESGCRTTVDLLSLTLLLPAPHRVGIVAMKDVLKSTVSLTMLPNKNQPLVAMTQSPEVALLSPKNLPPRVPRGKVSELIWHEWGPRVTTTLTLSLVPFIHCQNFSVGSQGFGLGRIFSLRWGNCDLAKPRLFLSDIYLLIYHSCLELNFYFVALKLGISWTCVTGLFVALFL